MEKPKSAVTGGSGLTQYGISILCFVSNMAVGLQEELSPIEESGTSKRIMPQLEQALTHALAALPLTREGRPCNNALEHERFA